MVHQPHTSFHYTLLHEAHASRQYFLFVPPEQSFWKHFQHFLFGYFCICDQVLKPVLFRYTIMTLFPAFHTTMMNS